MKIRAYIKIGKGKGDKFKISATPKPSQIPLKSSPYEKYLPTIYFALDFNIPDELFNQAARSVGEVNLSMEDVNVSSSIFVAEIKKAIKKAKIKTIKQ